MYNNKYSLLPTKNTQKEETLLTPNLLNKIKI